MRRHTTRVSTQWLREHDYSRTREPSSHRTLKTRRTAWAPNELSRSAKLELSFSDPHAPEAALAHLSEYGLVFVKHVPPSAAATEAFVRHFAWPRETLWGTHWSTSHDPAAGVDGTGPSDSA